MLVRNRLAVVLMVGVAMWAAASVVAAQRGSSAGGVQRNAAMSDKKSKSTFVKNLPVRFEFPTDPAGELLLREYGAVFLARNGSTAPNRIFFESEEEVQAFQRSLNTESARIGGITLELQTPAMRALKEAINTARSVGLSISPRGADSARRGYNQTIALWKSRVEPGLVHWVGRGRLGAGEAHRIRRLPIRQQITEILRLEQDGIYFAKSLDKSIIYSVAPPGSSQHLAMLALDVKEFSDPRVRSILAEHGWFQTVVSDLPHFTYLGVLESELRELGLKPILAGNRSFWIPDLPNVSQLKKMEPVTKPPPNRR